MKLTKEQRKLFYSILFPALIEQMLMKCFHLMDSIMLGQMENSTVAVAAVGLCGGPVHLITSVAVAFFVGTTATIAWHYGASAKEQVRSTAYLSMTLSLGIALGLSLFSILAARPIMTFVCGAGEVLEYAVTYYRIMGFGFFFQIITFNITACYRGIGVTKLPMTYNVIGGIFNVLLNYLLIFGHWGFPAMGIAGAALATSISLGISMFIALGSLFFKKSAISYQKGIRFKSDRILIKRMLPIGLTSAGEQLILQSGATLSAKIIAGLPVSSIAANQIVSNLEAFAWCSGAACNTASTTLFGRSLGAGNEKQARSYLRLTIRCALGFAAVEMLIMIFAGRPLAAFFSNDSSLYGMIQHLLVISAFALPVINCHQSVAGAMRGAGDSLAPLIASMISLWVFRVGGGYLLVCVLGLGIIPYRWCMVLDQAVRCLTVSVFYIAGHWKPYTEKKK